MVITSACLSVEFEDRPTVLAISIIDQLISNTRLSDMIFPSHLENIFSTKVEFVFVFLFLVVDLFPEELIPGCSSHYLHVIDIGSEFIVYHHIEC